MAQPNFLIGRGELLTANIPPIKRKMEEKDPLYSFVEAKNVLIPQISSVTEELNKLPDLACPDDMGVMSMILNPSFIAKTTYPKDVFLMQ